MSSGGLAGRISGRLRTSGDRHIRRHKRGSRVGRHRSQGSRQRAIAEAQRDCAAEPWLRESTVLEVAWGEKASGERSSIATSRWCRRSPDVRAGRNDGDQGQDGLAPVRRRKVAPHKVSAERGIGGRGVTVSHLFEMTAPFGGRLDRRHGTSTTEMLVDWQGLKVDWRPPWSGYRAASAYLKELSGPSGGGGGTTAVSLHQQPASIVKGSGMRLRFFSGSVAFFVSFWNRFVFSRRKT